MLGMNTSITHRQNKQPKPGVIMSDFEEFYEKEVQKLPQAKHIKKEDARAWLLSVQENDPARVNWHLKRLSGLGGSDIGEIAAWQMGYPNQFKTPADIVRDKLMKNPVGFQTPQMRRGSLLEPAIRQIFHEDFEASTNEKLKSCIEKVEHYGSNNHPWMRGNVDDVVEIDGSTYIVDYKSSSHVPPSAPIPYAAQVHQYACLLAEDQELELPGCDGLLICYFDYPSGEVVPIEVPFDPEIMQAVKEGGDIIWQHVLDGSYPDITPRERSKKEIPEEIKEQIQSLEEELVQANIYSCAAKDIYQNKQQELNNILKTYCGEEPLKEQSIPLQIMSSTVKCDLDHEELQQLVKNTQVDESTLKSTSATKFDEDKIKSFLKEHGQKQKDFKKQEFDPKKIIEFCDKNNLSYPFEEKVSVSIRSNNKALDKAALEGAKEHCRHLVQEGLGSIPGVEVISNTGTAKPQT